MLSFWGRGNARQCFNGWALKKIEESRVLAGLKSGTDSVRISWGSDHELYPRKMYVRSITTTYQQILRDAHSCLQVVEALNKRFASDG